MGHLQWTLEYIIFFYRLSFQFILLIRPFIQWQLLAFMAAVKLTLRVVCIYWLSCSTYIPFSFDLPLIMQSAPIYALFFKSTFLMKLFFNNATLSASMFIKYRFYYTCIFLMQTWSTGEKKWYSFELSGKRIGCTILSQCRAGFLILYLCKLLEHKLLMQKYVYVSTPNCTGSLPDLCIFCSFHFLRVNTESYMGGGVYKVINTLNLKKLKLHSNITLKNSSIVVEYLY